MLSFRCGGGLLASVAIGVVLTFTVPAANAAGSGLNVCNLLSASQLASVHVSAPCTQKTMPVNRQGTHVGTINLGRWGNIHQGYILAAVYVINPAYVGVAKQKFFNGGTSAGVGDWSRWKGFANGKDAARIVFGVGNRIVDLDVGPGSKHPLKSKQQVIALAKAIEGQL
ncbi:MAG TPA: hypothetical protein VF025_02035 [Gaiellaceae bacterium]